MYRKRCRGNARQHRNIDLPAAAVFPHSRYDLSAQPFLYTVKLQRKHPIKRKNTRKCPADSSDPPFLNDQIQSARNQKGKGNRHQDIGNTALRDRNKKIHPPETAQISQISAQNTHQDQNPHISLSNTTSRSRDSHPARIPVRKIGIRFVNPNRSSRMTSLTYKV